jgi:hypothetical protein
MAPGARRPAAPSEFTVDFRAQGLGWSLCISPADRLSSFCEEDYALSFYLAEFINSLTNVAYGMG